MIEAELKARLIEPDAVRAELAKRAVVERATYQDTYFDTPGEDLDRTGRELRLRTIDTGDLVRHVLTFKGPAVDQASGSKPEHESAITDRAAITHTFWALGYRPLVELTKACENYRFTDQGRDFLATMVMVPEIQGTFLEVETLADERDLDDALAAVRALLADLGVGEAELTTELYTDAVRAARSGR